MSDDGSKPEKAAGHNPAVKIGGARQVQRRSRRDSDEDSSGGGTSSTGGGGGEPVGMFSASPPRLTVTAGQQHTECVDRQFPTRAVRHTHDKPMPTTHHTPASGPAARHIQQPRK